jgi:hypothetical protein
MTSPNKTFARCCLALLSLALFGPLLSHGQESLYVRGTNLASLVVIHDRHLPGAEMQVMAATLQGLVAKRSTEQIYIDAAGGAGLWREYLATRYGVPQRVETNVWSLLRHFLPLVSGYVLYDAQRPDSLNVATSLAGPLNGVVAEDAFEARVREIGLTNRLFDASAWDEARAWRELRPRFHPRLVIEQREPLAIFLRDYAVLANAFTFFDARPELRGTVFQSLAPDALCFGWGSGEEGQFIAQASRLGVTTVPSDWARNLSTLSSVREGALRQHELPARPVETNVHYVTFVATDGDNVQWNLGGMPAYFNHPARGRFSMGWTISPSLVDLAPAALRWFYEHASNGPAHDGFIVGPSGHGYMNPSHYPPAELDQHVRRLNALMARGGLNIVQVIDHNAFGRLDLWDKFTAQPAVDAVFYLEFAPYHGARGAIAFSNGKPVIAARHSLWGGMAGADDVSVAKKLNEALRNPYSASGYSVVPVHVWSKKLSDVAKVVEQLAAHVRVVAPDELVRLVRTNLGRRLYFDFSTGPQEWIAGTSGKALDKADWSRKDGVLVLDGSDFGHRDDVPNAWFRRQVALPATTEMLRFDTRAAQAGRLRVRLRDAQGTWHTLLNWEALPDRRWLTRAVSVRKWAGQTVTIAFEQNDSGKGSGEHRFIDNVTIETAGAPAMIPAKQP